jgi:hypothetical protein
LKTYQKSAVIILIQKNITIAMISAKMEGEAFRDKVSDARVELEETSNRAKEYERGA